MLSDENKRNLSALCQKHRLGMPTPLERGMIRFTSNHPIRESIEKYLHNYEVIEEESGEAPTMDDRPDDMKYAFWVTVRPRNYD